MPTRHCLLKRETRLFRQVKKRNISYNELIEKNLSISLSKYKDILNNHVQVKSTTTSRISKNHRALKYHHIQAVAMEWAAVVVAAAVVSEDTEAAVVAAAVVSDMAVSVVVS